MTHRPYRGKRIDNDEWIDGWYHELDHGDHRGKAYIMPYYASAMYSYEVDPDTVGQYTGRDDYNGERIFEGSDVEVTLYDWNTKKVLAQETVKVIYRDCQFGFEWGSRKEFVTFSQFTNATFEVLDHPHLLKSE